MLLDVVYDAFSGYCINWGMLLDVVYDAFSGYCINWGTGCGYAFPECSPVAVGIELEFLICLAVYMESVRGVVCAGSDTYYKYLTLSENPIYNVLWLLGSVVAVYS